MMEQEVWDIRSRNLKHFGLEDHPESVSAAANDLSCGVVYMNKSHFCTTGMRSGTVGAQSVFGQQLGFRRSCPVYLVEVSTLKNE